MTQNTTHPDTTNTLVVKRLYTKSGVHPYEEVKWEKRDVVQTNWKSGETIFEQSDVEFPDFWSVNASTIVTTKYFRGALGAKNREASLKTLIDRVVNKYTAAAKENGYITNDEDLEIFDHELKYMLVHQVFAFNSPVWFNVGTSSPQQVSACFILAVDDTMESILNWYREEGMIFKGGSGAGLNLSRIRSSKELLKSSGGSASGPVSFMRGADASAGTIKSGGATRRAAKMVVLDVDHPDINQFVETKAREEKKIRVLRDAGFDMDLGGEDIASVQYQNANNSVRVNDKFMEAVRENGTFDLLARTDGRVIETIEAKKLFRHMSEAAWECADPGIQYDTTINRWHTTPEAGRINASNPCSEYMSLDNSSCNLASLNLMKFRLNDGGFDFALFVRAVEFVITAMEVSISFADFPTKAIGETTRNFRQLGIGYANLGALLMASGLAYDSAEGRAVAGSITSLMTGVSYRRSAEIAGVVGSYAGYEANKESHIRVMEMHRNASSSLLNTLKENDSEPFVRAGIVESYAPALGVAETALAEWKKGIKIGKVNGWRNAQASVLAPTGTIGFMMDCDTTGVEPDFSLVKFKKLVGGGSLQIVNGQVPLALEFLGYNPEARLEIEAYIVKFGNVVGAPNLKPEHYSVFDCAIGERFITAMGHVRMMSAAQPFLSGAISKTVNLPESATVEEIEDVYYQGWTMGIKALAVYRDNCKVGQPLSDAKAKSALRSDGSLDVISPLIVEKIVEKVIERPKRTRLPKRRQSITTSFRVGEVSGYLTVGEYVNGQPGEVFIKVSKQGSTLAGIMDAFSLSTSIALQYGVPLETFVSKFANMRFEPAGITDDPDVRMAQSVLDYIVRRLALDYLPFETRSGYGIYTTAERTIALETGVYAPVDEDFVAQDEVAPALKSDPVVEVTRAIMGTSTDADREHLEDVTPVRNDKMVLKMEAPMCLTCGTAAGMERSGACFSCRYCGSSTGCS